MSVNLTIITATYNRGYVISSCLESVLEQDYKDKEHLIIDNMSSDDTERIVLDYQKRADYPVYYIREPDKGIYNAFNKGIKKANGKWIHFINSDDKYYDKSTLSAIFSEDVDSCDLIATNIIKDHGNRMELRKANYNERMKSYNFPHPGTILKKKLLVDNGLYEENFKISADTAFNCKHYNKAKYVIFDETLVLMSTEGISHKQSLSMLIEKVRILLFYRRYPIIKKARFLADYIVIYIKAKVFRNV